MNKEKWVETRKEFEITETGERRPTKIILELDKSNSFNKKDIFDITLRTIAAFSIAIPFFILAKQQNVEARKQRELFKLEVYTNASILIHTMLKGEIGSEEYESTKDKVYYEIHPKILLIGEKDIIAGFLELKDQLYLNQQFGSLRRRLRSLDNMFFN